jgi:hypothetical protein
LKVLTASTGKRQFAHRCVVVAQALSPSLLGKIDEYQIPASWIYDNKYFVGQGAGAAIKLITTAGRLACIENVHEDLLANRAVAAISFIEEYCATMKAGETWVEKQRKIFGSLCDLPLFERCNKYMKSNRARTQIYSCLRGDRKFDNAAADAPGIEQCRAVVAELEKLKAAPKADARSAASPSHGLDAASAAGGASGHGLDVASAPTDPNNILFSAAVHEEALEKPDPMRDAAMKKTDIALGKLQYYNDLQEVTRCLPAIVRPSHSVMVLVEAPTSKLRVVLELMEKAKSIVDTLGTKQVCIAIPSGPRLDLLSTVANKSELLWSAFLNTLEFFKLYVPTASGRLVALGRLNSIRAAVASISPVSHQSPWPFPNSFERTSRHSWPSADCFISHHGLRPTKLFFFGPVWCFQNKTS